MKINITLMTAILFACSLAFAESNPFHSRVFWENAQVEQVQKHIDAGIDVNQPTEDGLTPLSFAAMKNSNPAVIEVLIKAGAVIDPLEAPFGWTPLFLASMSNSNPAVIKVLIKAGADIDQRCQGISSTPLIDAVVHNPNPQIAMTLLEYGANTKLKDENGYSALNYVENNSKLKNSELHEALKPMKSELMATRTP